MTFEEAASMAIKFREEREWNQFHNPKDLAISLNLEAAELLECFQWSGTDLVASSKQGAIEEELADIMVYCIYMADTLGVDIATIISSKINKNAEKYPVEKAKGSSRKYTEL